MQQYSTRRHLRPILAIAGVAAIMSACSGDEPNPLGGNPAGADLAVGVEVSSARAAAGEQVAVAIRAEGREPLGGLQGTLKYDASRLAFVGQAVEGGKVTIVNPSKAGQGELRVISYEGGTGIGNRSGTLVFAVKGGDYTQSLQFDLEMATDVAGAKELARYSRAATAEAADLRVPSGAGAMGLVDWNQSLYADVWRAESLTANSAGQYLANLHYGNANLSAESASSCTSVNVLDASYIGNIAVGNNSVLAVDFPTRDPVVAGNVSPNSSPIPGVGSGGTRVIDVLDAQAVANEAVGNLRPVVCDLIPGREPTPGNIVTVSGSIASNRTFTRDTIYRLSGVVKVNGGATLTIEPGTRIEGIYNASAFQISELIIERDGRIDAQGTELQPIVFTCDQTPKFKGCWGGLAIMGNASVNANQSATLTSPIIAGRAAIGGCFQVTFEGTTGTPSETQFGGCNDADSSGVVRYAIIEYGGYAFAANSELNNLTVGGVGSSTVLEFIQVHAGLDDGFEIWGGTFSTRNLVMTANSDDDFDFASGWSGNAQFLIIQKDSLDGEKSFEIDNTESSTLYNSLPRVNGQVYNVTMVGAADPTSTSGVAGNNVNDAIQLRRGARPDFFNFVMIGYPVLMDLDDDATCPTGADLSTEVKWQSITAFNFTRIDNADTEANCQPYTPATSMEDEFYNEAAFGNLTAPVLPLIAPYNVVTPDWRPISAAAISQGSSTVPPSNGFFDVTANYRGAVPPLASGGIPWYAGWTRVWASATTP
jgi:hypothetical protein